MSNNSVRRVSVRRRSLGRWGTVAALAIVGAGLIIAGTLGLRVQHSGIPARVTVKSCHHSGGIRRARGACSGVLVPGSGGGGAPHRRVNVWFVDDPDVGHDVDVHISRKTKNPVAIPDRSIFPPIMLVAGCALAGAGVITAVITVVRRPRSTVPTGGPTPDSTQPLPPR
jgi:hypothetical protein